MGGISKPGRDPIDPWLRDSFKIYEIQLENTPRRLSLENAYDEEAQSIVYGPASTKSDVTTLLDQVSIVSGGSFKKGENDLPKRERPKIVLNRNRRTAFIHFLIFHAVPFGAAIALIVMNTCTRFYGSSGKWILAVQFVAKAHELLMQISIGAVVVAFLQYMLTHQKAVPFGAIFSAYNITQMNYLWSREFRGAATAPNFQGLIKIAFVLFVPFTILLTAGVGPSSAIAMQPRQSNFTVGNYTIFLNVTGDAMYPSGLLEPGLALLSLTDSQIELSPAAGWQNLRNLPVVGGQYDANILTEAGWQLPFGPSVDVAFVLPRLYSVPLQTFWPAWESQASGSIEGEVMRTLYVQYAPNSTFSTIPHVPIAYALAQANLAFMQPMGDNAGKVSATIEIPQAFTSVLCELNTIMGENDTRPFQFPNTYVSSSTGLGDDADTIDTFNISNYTAITRKQVWDESIQTAEGRIIWRDDIPISNPVAGTSLGAIVVQPKPCGLDKSFLMTSACVIGARWANAPLQQAIENNGFDESNAPSVNLFNLESLSVLPRWSQPSINLSRAWAESLNPVTAIEDRTVADNLLQFLPVTSEICPPNGVYESESAQLTPTRPFMHEAILAGLVANGLSHAAGPVFLAIPEPGGWGILDFGLSESATPLGGISLTFQGYLPGYAWTLEGVPIKIALTVLILYCLLVSTYVVFTLVTGRSSTTWSSISDLAALALASTPPEGGILKNSSAGITRVETFRNLVSVREVDANKRLEMVFQEEGAGLPHQRVTIGRAY